MEIYGYFDNNELINIHTVYDNESKPLRKIIPTNIKPYQIETKLIVTNNQIPENELLIIFENNQIKFSDKQIDNIIQAILNHAIKNNINMNNIKKFKMFLGYTIINNKWYKIQIYLTIEYEKCIIYKNNMGIYNIFYIPPSNSLFNNFCTDEVNIYQYNEEELVSCHITTNIKKIVL